LGDAKRNCTLSAIIPVSERAPMHFASFDRPGATVTNIAALGKFRCFGKMAVLAICVPPGSAIDEFILFEAAPADLVVGFAV
jgi:hypothetical protein